MGRRRKYRSNVGQSLNIQALQKNVLQLWKKDQFSARELGKALITLRNAMKDAHGEFAKWFGEAGLDENRVYYCIREAEGKNKRLKKLDPGANATDGKHYWLTPPTLYKELDAEFDFDFDPCPFPRPKNFDGLKAEWGQRNYVNPPFSTENGIGITAWIRKAIAEQQKGKMSVIVVPQNGWVLMLLEAMGLVNHAADVRNLGPLRWIATEDKLPMNKGSTSPIACFVLRGKNTKAARAHRSRRTRRA